MSQNARDPHGTRQRFGQGCKCDPCRKAWNRYNYSRIQARRRGDWRGAISAERARDHIESLNADSICIASLAGVHRSSVERIRRGQQRISTGTEAAILAVTPAIIKRRYHRLATRAAFIDATETLQMIEDLRASGFSPAFLGQQLGITSLRVSRSKVRLWNARRIERLYRETGTISAHKAA